MRSRKRAGRKPGAVMRKVRKPVPPPTKVEEDTTKYRRARERERVRREQPEIEPEPLGPQTDGITSEGN